jgi:NAD(P)-dependent dehydrogenase (short-subunit alcohol dehydrogenase family)
LIQPDEVAALIHWLCGRDSGAMTGAVLPVDAGMTAG